MFLDFSFLLKLVSPATVRGRRHLALGGAALAGVMGIWGIVTHDASSTAKPTPGGDQAAAVVVARGRIEPFSRVIALHGVADGAIVGRLLVDQGDRVEAGQILATLDTHDIRQAEMMVAERNLRLAELTLAQVKTGAKTSEVAAQRDAVAAKRAQLAWLRQEWKRRSALYEHEFASRQSIEQLRSELAQTESEVAQAGNTLRSLSETRGVDAEVAAARVAVAQAELSRAEAELEHTLIRAPENGSILSIQTRAGEAMGPDGLLRMAALDRIDVVAEVDETQAPRLRLGMQAAISAPMLDHPVSGHVTRISQEVFRQKRPSSDVLIGRDARIVEVEVTPDQPLPVVLGAEVMVRLSAGSAEIAESRP